MHAIVFHFMYDIRLIHLFLHFFSRTPLYHHIATELTSEYHQSPIQTSTSIKIFDQLRNGAVNLFFHLNRSRMSVLMSVPRSEEHTSELQSRGHLVCRLLLEKKKKHNETINIR